MRVAVVGAGFSGIGITIGLKQDGVEDVVVYERGADVGGVWHANTYPGAGCDVPSPLYSFSFASHVDWSRRYAPQAEIAAYLRRVAAEHDVLRHVRLRTEVLAATWDDGAARWRLDLSDGSTDEADVLVTACGQLSRPAVPRIEGLDRFAGPVFHTAEWDHDADLDGRRVAVLGTGASAVQAVPEIAPRTSALTLFQRTPPYVLHKHDTVYGPAVRALRQRSPLLVKADRLVTYLLTEGRSLGFNTAPSMLAGHQLRFAVRLRRQVRDRELRRTLTPPDRIGCKRVLISNAWYAALQLPHVRVVPERIERVEPDAVVTSDGARHPADVLVLATGFTATDLVAPMRVTGRDGRTLAEAWRDGAEAHRGTTVAGFPNLFLMYGPNTNLGHTSIVLMLEAQFRYVRQAVRLLAEGRARSVEVRADAQRAWNAVVQQRLRRGVWATGCRSWYLTPDGRNPLNWPGTTLEFRLRTRRFRPEEHVLEPARERVGA